MSTFYHSTRSRNESVTSKQAILEGIAADGGLFVRDDIASGAPALDELLSGTYQDRASCWGTCSTTSRPTRSPGA